MSRFVQATCRYFFFADFGPGPHRNGVSIPQNTAARRIGPRIVFFPAPPPRAPRPEAVPQPVDRPGPENQLGNAPPPLNRTVVNTIGKPPGPEIYPLVSGPRPAPPPLRRARATVNPPQAPCTLVPVFLGVLPLNPLGRFFTLLENNNPRLGPLLRVRPHLPARKGRSSPRSGYSSRPETPPAPPASFPALPFPPPRPSAPGAFSPGCYYPLGGSGVSPFTGEQPPQPGQPPPPPP